MKIKSRLNLKIDSDLKDWAMDYAQRNGVNLTDLICLYLRQLRREEEQLSQQEPVAQL